MGNDVFFSIGDLPVYLMDFLILCGIFLLFAFLIFIFNKYFLKYIGKKEDISSAKLKKGSILFLILIILLFFDVSIVLLDIRYTLFNRIETKLIIEALILLVLVYLVLWVATNVFIHKYFKNREKPQVEVKVTERDTESIAIKTLRWLLFSIALLILLRYINWDYTLWNIPSPKENAPDILIRLSSIINTILIYLIARLSIWIITQLLLFGYYRRKQFDQGVSYSINKLLAYIIYFAATLIALRNLGMDMGLLLGGAAALLVGVGLALQSTFSDFFSGLILLFERPIKIGDYVTFEGKPAEVQKIGLRASKVRDRDSINYIIPNSKLITQTVINWSYDEKSVRFQVNVGVAYGSDTDLVENLLIQAAIEHKDVLKRPKPKVVFSDFGNSSLDFQLNFYSRNIYNIEWVKSDIRFKIDRLFREHHVTIPFPQRDVWMRKG